MGPGRKSLRKAGRTPTGIPRPWAESTGQYGDTRKVAWWAFQGPGSLLDSLGPGRISIL